MEREETFLAWVGRREKLIRIATEVDKALVAAYKDLLTERDLHPETVVEDREEADKLARLLQPSVTVIAGKGRIKRSGNLEAILNDMDAREIECITIGNGDRHRSPGTLPGIFIQFGEEGPRFLLFDRDVVQLKVSGPDRQWIGGVFDNLATELRKDVPWWAPLRSTFAAILIGLFVFGSATQLLYTMTPEPPQSEDINAGTLIILRLMTVLIMAFVGYMIARPALRRIFPAVEVLEAGASPRGRQVLAVTVGILSFALGVAGVVLGVLAL
ncbi:hypothetical protein CQ020_03590 [Arthrobacter sp. MYb23]|uniref:hypothetical protein n=1 Tax=unclassified Arthrobacter TaxID=235627 RepID=UPI000CFD66CC|nr:MULTISPECIES: hypothetical protein [unclassified Arthrobacter]PRB44303.1 hypothetical protein CQ038_03445 [Arthrobacter sp. MYb51]PRB98555.1 hypothetical protein CQ020_03590 [Arthrobacter sp. MYb23]